MDWLKVEQLLFDWQTLFLSPPPFLAKTFHVIISVASFQSIVQKFKKSQCCDNTHSFINWLNHVTYKMAASKL